MNILRKSANKIDGFQQRYKAFSFPIAVFKKYSDDQAGQQAALITYYAFLSLFPLLLVFLSVTEILIRKNIELQHRIINSALEFFPVVGNQLQNNLYSVHRTGLSLVVGLVLSLFGARGVAHAVQNALNHIWGVEKKQRPGFPWNMLRSLGMIVVGGIGLVASTTLAASATAHSHDLSIKALMILIALIVNFIVFLVSFRLATARLVPTEDMIAGAAISAILWQIFQAVGSYLVLYQLKGASAIYGTFAIVIGLMVWIYFLAQATLYAVEVDVVRARKLWPRKIF